MSPERLSMNYINQGAPSSFLLLVVRPGARINSDSATTIQKLRFRNQNSETAIQKLRFSNYDSETTIQKPRFRNQDSETTIQQLRFRNYDSETTPAKPRFRNYDSETTPPKLRFEQAHTAPPSPSIGIGVSPYGPYSFRIVSCTLLVYFFGDQSCLGISVPLANWGWLPGVTGG